MICQVLVKIKYVIIFASLQIYIFAKIQCKSVVVVGDYAPALPCLAFSMIIIIIALLLGSVMHVDL
jgi:hypothetical protein